MKDNSKKNQMLLAVIGVATLLVAVVGATFAYFSAAGVTGNADTNNINAQTARYGNTTVAYDPTYGAINTGLLNLPEEEKETDYKFLMKFTVATTATIDQQIKISWQNINNTFCQYKTAAGQCGTESDTPVTGEVIYDLYSCSGATPYGNTTASQVNKTVTVDAGCTKISATPDVPLTGNAGLVHTAESLLLTAGGTNYYALVVTIKNTGDPQDYLQDGGFSGRVDVSIVAQ